MDATEAPMALAAFTRAQRLAPRSIVIARNLGRRRRTPPALGYRGRAVGSHEQCDPFTGAHIALRLILDRLGLLDRRSTPWKPRWRCARGEGAIAILANVLSNSDTRPPGRSCAA